MDKGAWWATVHGVAKGRTQLSDSHFALSLSMHDTGKRLTEQDGWVDGWMNREMSGSQTSHHSSEVSLTFCPIQLDLTVPQVFS